VAAAADHPGNMDSDPQMATPETGNQSTRSLGLSTSGKCPDGGQTKARM